jgi:hypothetical protein
MKPYTISQKEFNHLAQEAETSDGSIIRVAFLPPLIFMSPADATEIHEGSELKLMKSMLYLRISSPCQTAGRFKAFSTVKGY